jgi:hypothetical protein
LQMLAGPPSALAPSGLRPGKPFAFDPLATGL